MKRKLTVVFIVLLAALCATSAWAQTTTVKGKVTDLDGKPMPNIVIEMTNRDNGRKFTFKTDAKGQYHSIGVNGGVYNVRVLTGDQVLMTYANVPISLGQEENVFDVDFAKEKVRSEAINGEERAKREAAVKENEKIAGLNEMLKQTNAAVQAGNYDQAVLIMRRATASDASHDVLWGRLCEVDLIAARRLPSSERPKAQEYYEEAVTGCSKAIALKPVGAYYNNLGEAYSRLGKSQDAAQQYALAAQNDPPNAGRYYFNQGAVLTNAGQMDAANAAFDKAIAANPEYADAYYQKAINLMGKAKVDEKTGTMTAPPEVAANLNKYLALAPNGPNAVTAKQFLDQLGAKVETSYGTSKGKKK